ncbi:hypothetical protein ACFSTA_04565 [Ornithinibacillus salinisoli]|uniref:Uncharacterized protein n=1 Tax=Ornithinibacillus salinisoli TaxID=1848459 RepID=A0ABW4VY63_9BACI
MIKRKKKIFLIISTVFILLGGIYATTYIPKKIISIEPSKVSKIEIFDGNRGEPLTVIDTKQKEHIISNLNNITFKKEKLSIGYLGYKFRVTIYNDKGKVYKELIINNTEKIRYKGFFYTDKSKSIAFDYINNLFLTMKQ